MSPELQSFLLEQSPIIIILVLITVRLMKYINEKNKVIKTKDDQILAEQARLIELHGNVMEMYGKAVDSQTRLTIVIEELRKDIERKSH